MSSRPDPDDDDRTLLRATVVDTQVGRLSGISSFASHTLPEGTVLGGLEITGLIGEGGFGIVYLAFDRGLERQVAIKEYMPSSLATRATGSMDVQVKSDRHAETFKAGLKSFVNEARLLARFDHDSLVKVFRFWEANGTAYMAMPYYEGPTLKRALADMDARPDEAQLRAWLHPILDALSVMHQGNCFHRDIAPDNILLTANGPLLLDFGAARRVIGDMTHALTVVLKPGYAPIEQYGDSPNMAQGAWTDLYALGCVVYYAITGKTPMSSVERLMGDRLPPLSQIAAGRYSKAFLRAIDAALVVHPQQRPQDVAQFRALLDDGLPAAPVAQPKGPLIPADRDGQPGSWQRTAQRTASAQPEGRGDSRTAPMPATMPPPTLPSPTSPILRDDARRPTVPYAADSKTIRLDSRRPSPPSSSSSPSSPSFFKQPHSADPGHAVTTPPPVIQARLPQQPPAVVPAPRQMPVMPPRAERTAWAPEPSVAYRDARPVYPHPQPDQVEERPVTREQRDKRVYAVSAGVAVLALSIALLVSVLRGQAPQTPVSGPAATASSVPSAAASPASPTIVQRPAETEAAASAATVARPPVETPAVVETPSASASMPAAEMPRPPVVAEVARQRTQQRPVAETRKARPPTSEVSTPTNQQSRPARCSDILQKASLEALDAEEVAFLRRECR